MNAEDECESCVLTAGQVSADYKERRIIMDLLKKLWPTCFGVKKGDVGSLIIQLIIFLVICIVGGVIIGVLGSLVSILWPLWSIIGGLFDLYGLVGIVLCVLKFFDVVK